MLTGKMQTQAMRIYAVSHSGRLSDVTSQTTCHSGDEDALKVCLLACNDSAVGYWSTNTSQLRSRNLRVFGISVKISVRGNTKTPKENHEHNDKRGLQ